MIKIEKEVPIPENVGRSALYPFADMEIGDSFFVPNKSRVQMDNAASHWRKKNGWKFTIQVREENGVSGCRVWRTE